MSGPASSSALASPSSTGKAGPKPPPKHFWSPSEVAELTAAAVAAMPSSITQAAASLTLNAKKMSTHRNENGDIVHHHQSTHRANNATLVTSTTTTIHHHVGSLKPTTTTTTTTSVQQQQFSIHAHTSTHNHSHGHHHHHHHLPPPLVNSGSNLLLANGSALVPSSAAAAVGLDPAVLAANHATLVASPSFQGDLNKIDLGLNSDDADVQLEAAKKLRGLLSSERDLLIRQVCL